MSDYYEHLVNNMSDGVLLMFYATGYSQPGSFASEAIAEAGVELLHRLRTRKEALNAVRPFVNQATHKSSCAHVYDATENCNCGLFEAFDALDQALNNGGLSAE